LADVFLSYRNTDERRAYVERLQLCLIPYEIKAWWDYGLEAGKEYEPEILRKLDESLLVCPLWCQLSIESQWVAREAQAGVDGGKFFPARLQRVTPPDAFEKWQAQDLVGWQGAPDDPRVQAFAVSVLNRLGRPMKLNADLLRGLRALPLLPPLEEVRPAARAAPAPVSLTSTASPAWVQIEGSLDAQDYLDFETHFPDAPEVRFAKKCLADLEAWAKVDRAKPDQVEAFLKAGPFEALAQLVRETLQASEKARLKALEDARRRTPGAEFRDSETLPLMVTIPPGTFRMGSPPTEKNRRGNEGPQREVTIAYPLAVGIYPVTVGEWKTFVAATQHGTGKSAYVRTAEEWNDTPGRGWASPGFAQDDRHPVTCVNWNDAQAYAAWASKLSGQTYRLLSEAEWEYACRAGTTTRYAFGAEVTSAQANFNEEKGGTTPVGSYAANAFGLNDMHGNVWEWIEDCYADTYGAGQPSDGSAFAMSSTSFRVLRGGSWGNEPDALRSAARYRDYPTNRYDVTGFRLARTLVTP
jgi:formylglycine-generating enzyme required for sulfatase activity